MKTQHKARFDSERHEKIVDRAAQVARKLNGNVEAYNNVLDLWNDHQNGRTMGPGDHAAMVGYLKEFKKLQVPRGLEGTEIFAFARDMVLEV